MERRHRQPGGLSIGAAVLRQLRRGSTAAFRDRGVELCALLPRICTDRETPGLLSLLEKAREIGCASLAVQNLGQLALGERTGLAMRGGPGLNVFNSRSLAQCRDWGLASAALSFELRYEQIRDLKKPLDCEAAVYGRLPLMITENCLISNAGRGCPVRQGRASPCAAVHTLTDRRGAFPILSEMTLICNFIITSFVTVLFHASIKKTPRVPVLHPEIEVVEDLPETARGAGGFGSTGR